MKWRRIRKENAIQPQTGSYRDWKQYLAKEGFHQCVYCAVPDVAMGGLRNFHVEHYRPKSRFPDLKDIFSNLYYACPICNTFKSNDWPAEPDFNIQCYPNPSEVDYQQLFIEDVQPGEIRGKVVASRYMVERIHLNRGQLILERRLHLFLSSAHILRGEVLRLLELLPNESKLDFQGRFIRIINEMIDLMGQLQTITPYELQDIQR